MIYALHDHAVNKLIFNTLIKIIINDVSMKSRSYYLVEYDVCIAAYFVRHKFT